jgi:DNA polymerase-3 subunit delta
MLPDSLKSSPRPIYLLSSDEPLLIRDWLDSARKTLRESGFEEILSHQVESGFDWEGLLQESQNLSLFSEKKCHIIQFSSSRPGQVGARYITSLCEAGLEDTVVILVMPKLDMASRNSAWVKKIMQRGEHCELASVYANKLTQWVSQRALAKGLMLDEQAVMCLADFTEGNLLATDQELEKLVLVFGTDARLSLEQMSDSISRSARYTQFLLVDACLAGNTRRAVKILQGLQLEGVQPIQIQYSLQATFEQLLELKSAQQQQRLNAGLWKSLRIWQAKQALFSRALSRFSYRQIERFIQSCAKLDRINKGQQQPLYVDADWLALKQLVYAFAGLPEMKKSPIHKV